MDTSSGLIKLSSVTSSTHLQLLPLFRRADPVHEFNSILFHLRHSRLRFSILLLLFFVGLTFEWSTIDLGLRRDLFGPIWTTRPRRFGSCSQLQSMAATTATMATTTAMNTCAHGPVNVRHADPRKLSSVLIRRFFGGSSFSERNARLSQRSGNVTVLPVIKAQAVPEYLPDAKFYKVEAIVRPWRVPQVSAGLLKIGISGVTVSDVRGFGAQGGLPERQGGSEFSEDNFVAKVKMEIVISKDQVELVINQLIEEARTGEIGDGKIFVVPVADVIRVRTGERGENAARMSGGRHEISKG